MSLLFGYLFILIYKDDKMNRFWDNIFFFIFYKQFYNFYNFNYTNRFKLNDFNQFEIKKVGLSNVFYRQFSTKVDRIND